jgi:hypothetical protein
MNPGYIYWFCILYGTIYSLFKIRAEFGCKGTALTTKRQCIDENSVYLEDTSPQHNDSLDTLRRKLANVLSYHEKTGVWKICLLMANVLTLFVYIILDVKQPVKALVPLHLSFFALQYFYFNFINFHHLRRLKEAGMRILANMMMFCRVDKT